MLQIGIHHRYIRRTGSEHALDTCRRQTASSDPLDDSDTVINLADPSDDGSGLIGRVVVDEDDLPLHVTQGDVDPSDEFFDVRRLVEGRDNDGQLAGDAEGCGVVGGRQRIEGQWSAHGV